MDGGANAHVRGAAADVAGHRGIDIRIFGFGLPASSAAADMTCPL